MVVWCIRVIVIGLGVGVVMCWLRWNCLFWFRRCLLLVSVRKVLVLLVCSW